MKILELKYTVTQTENWTEWLNSRIESKKE